MIVDPLSCRPARGSRCNSIGLDGANSSRCSAPHPLALLRARRERPRRRAAEQRDEVASFQPIELHLVPAAKPDGRI